MVISAKLEASSTTLAIPVQSENTGRHHLRMAEIAALATSETISRKPMPRIIPNDSRRARSSDQSPDVRSRTGARQMRSSASCSSPNTDVAPTSSTATPKIVAGTLSVGCRTLCSSPWTAIAPGAPSSSWSWPKISPRAASSPNTSPAMEITISSRGAIENIV